MAPAKTLTSDDYAGTDSFFQYSVPLDPAQYEDDEYFCQFTPRIHRDAYVADAGSLQCQLDFLGSSAAFRAAAKSNEDKDHKSYAVGCINPVVGNFTALCACEAIPDRLALTTYMVEYAYIHDDVIEYAEDKDESRLWEANKELVEGISLDDVANGGTKDHVRRRQLQAKMVVEMMDVDPKQGRECVRLWKEMSDVFVQIRDLDFKTIDEYLPFRVVDAGCPWTMAILTFSMDFGLNQNDIEKTSEITAAAYNAWVLVNDYFSWAKELKNYEANGSQGQIVSAVFLYMKWHSVPWQEAKAMLRKEIIARELAYIRAKEDFMARGHSNETTVKWLTLLDLITAGNFAWSMTTARYSTQRPDTYPALRAAQQDKGEINMDEALSWPISINVAKISENKDSVNHTIQSDGTPRDKVLPVQEDKTSVEEVLSTHVDNTSEGEVLPIHLDSAPGEDVSPSSKSVSSPASSGGEFWSNMDTAETECSSTGSTYQDAFESVALEPSVYLEGMPSKGVRSAAIDGLEAWYRVPERSLETIRYIVNTLHSSSLMLDDIQDQSETRRGFAATHMVYGVAQTINSANLLMFKALRAARELSTAAVDILVDRIAEGHIGQGMDLHWSRQTEAPTESEYFAMVDGKTGGLFVLLAQLMRSEASLNKDLDLTSAMKAFGRWFQARDDYQNINDAQYAKEKGYADDVNEGKMSLPMIHALEAGQDNKACRSRLLNAMQQRKAMNGLPLEVRQLVVNAIKDSGALERTKLAVMRLQKEVDGFLAQSEQQAGSKNWILRLVQKRLEL